MKKTLIFCAGAPHPNLKILSQIPYNALIGVDGGAAHLVQHGFIPDWAIGDFDTTPPPRQCAKVLRLLPEKDDTDLEAALLYILDDYAPEDVGKIIILGALNGGRLDHLLANIWLANQPRFAMWLSKIHLIERGNSIRFYHAGMYEIAPEKDKKYLSFIGLTPICSLTVQQVKYPVHERDYPQPVALISNEFSGSIARFSFQSGIMCVIQSCDIAVSY